MEDSFIKEDKNVVRSKKEESVNEERESRNSANIKERAPLKGTEETSKEN